MLVRVDSPALKLGPSVSDKQQAALESSPKIVAKVVESGADRARAVAPPFSDREPDAYILMKMRC